jgi:hypothetical protein
MTNELRDALVRKVLAQAFKAEDEQLAQDDEATGLEIYAKLYSAPARELAKNLGREWVHHSNEMTVRVYPEAPIDNRTRDTLVRWKVVFKEDMPLQLAHQYGKAEIVDRKIYARLVKLQGRYAALERKREELRVKTIQVTMAHKTIEKLLAAWHEGRQFLPEGWDAPKPQLPTVLPGDLNKLLKKAGVELRA